MYLYKNIKAIRTRLGMNLKQFGKLFGLSSNTMSHYENGKRQPPWQFLAKLEIMTGITFRDMHSQLLNIMDIPEMSSSEMQRRISVPTFSAIEMAIIDDSEEEEIYPAKKGKALAGPPALVNDDTLRAELFRIHQLIAEIEARVSSLEKGKGK